MSRIKEESRSTYQYRFLTNNGWKVACRIGPNSLEVYCEHCGMVQLASTRTYPHHELRPCICTFVGQKFEKLKVIGTRGRMALCQCDCNGKIWMLLGDLKKRKSCGCLHEEFLRHNKNFVNLIGKKYGKLKVIGLDRFVDYVGTRQYYWTCECACKEKHVVAGSNLKTFRIKNCRKCRKKSRS